MFNDPKKTMLKEIKKSMTIMLHQIKNTYKEVKLLKQQHRNSGVEKYNNQN